MALPLAIAVTCVKSRLDTSSTPREYNLFKVKSTDTHCVVNGAPIEVIISDATKQGFFTEDSDYTLTFT